MNSLSLGRDSFLRDMTDARLPTSPEALLAHRAWVRALARSLVIDESRADDIEQQTWLAAMEHGPRNAESPRAWLGAVVRNWGRRLARSEGRRARHELAAARPEAQSVADLAAEAEAQRRVADAVLALAEPYRTTVLLRFLEDLPPREIARRTGAPVETVKTRLQRALAQLRSRLDEEHGGDRRAWCIVLLPLARGATVMKTSTKASLAAAALLLMGLIGGTVWTLRASESSSPANVSGAETATKDLSTSLRRGRSSEVPSPDATQGLRVDRGPRVGSLAVDVRDVAGNPLPGAHVEAYRDPVVGLMSDTWTTATHLRERRAPVAVGKTDSVGRARLGRLVSSKYTVVAELAKHVRTGIEVDVHAGVLPDVLELRLEPGATLAGRVVDRGGRPLAGARLLATGMEQLLGHAVSLLNPCARTDAQGRFAFDAIAPGEVAIWVAPEHGLPGCAGKVRVPFAGDLELRLDGNRVSGRISEEPGGDPISGALVRGYCSTYNGNELGCWIVEGTSDASGRYELDTVFRAGVSAIRVEMPGYVAAARSGPDQSSYVRFDPQGQATHDVVLRRGARLVGTVFGPDGPVVGAQVSAMWMGFGLMHEDTVTDDAGRYEVVVPEGLLVVMTRAEGLSSESPPDGWYQRLGRDDAFDGAIRVPASGQVRHDVELRRGTVVDGWVTSADGVPIAGAKVTGLWPAEPTTDPGGRFRATGVAPGRPLQVAVAKDGFIIASQTVVAKDETTPVELRIELRPAPHVVGHVATADGSPARNASVQVLTTNDLDRWRYVVVWEMWPRRAVLEDGSYDVPLTVDEGTVVVRASGPGLQPVRSERVPLARGEMKCVVDLVLVRNRTIEGRVVTGTERRGVSGARIRVGKAPASRAPDPSKPGVAAVSDAQGSFRTDASPGPTLVSVEADGFVDAKTTIDVPTAQALVIELVPGLEISGRIEFADGRPVEGVSTSVARGGESFGFAPETGADGCFRVRGLAAGSYGLTFRGSLTAGNILTKAVDAIPAGTNDLHVVVQEGGVIAGRVHGDDGRPVRRVRVVALAADGNSGHEGESSADGSFRIVSLEPGLWSVIAPPPQSGGDKGVAEDVVYRGVRREGVQVGTLDLELILPVGEKIEGVLLGADGAPWASAYVGALVGDGRREDPRMQSSSLPLGARTDAAGRFSITGLAPGRYRVVQITKGDGPRATQRDLEGGADVASGTSGLRLVAGSLPAIGGVVVDDVGRPLPFARLGATLADGSGRLATGSAADGRFQFADLTRGATYRLVVRANDFAPANVDGVVAGTTSLRIQLSRGLGLAGRVTDGSGAVVANVQLQIVDEKYGDPCETTTDSDGRFAIDHLGPGAYRVEALFSSPGKRCVVRPCGTVRAGDTDVHLQMAEERKP